MSASDYAAMGQPYTVEEIEKMESDDVNLKRKEIFKNVKRFFSK